MNHLRGETCKKGRETGEEGACVPRFWQFGEQQFGFRVVFIGPQVFKTKDANDSEGLGYGLLVPAKRRFKYFLSRSMCIDICVTFRLTGSSCTAQHSKSLRQERKTPTKQDPCTVRHTGNGYRNDSSSVRTFPNFIVC